MKNLPYLFVLLCLLVSCEDVSYSDASVLIRIEGVKTSKHIEADVFASDGAYYTVSGSGPSGSTVSSSISLSESSVKSFSGLKAGLWTFTVNLYTSSGQLSLSGTRSVNLSNGSNELSIELSEAAGRGSVGITVMTVGASVIPSGMTGEVTLIDSAYMAVVRTFSMESSGTGYLNISNLNAGYYDMNITLRDKDGEIIGGAREMVRIISGLDAQGTVKIPLEDINVNPDQGVIETEGTSSVKVKLAFKNSHLFSLSKNGSRLSPMFEEAVTSSMLSGCTFQWYENGVLLPSARSSSYTVSRSSGRYRYDLIISFSDGTKSSAGINLQL